MEDRIRHIKDRNLVVCETFDDFAEVVRNTDFTVEDVVGYVTSLTNNYYWLNIESVWGVIGFTWTPSSLEPLTDEEALQYPNPLYRLEQVTAEGINIPIDDQWLIDHKLSKGTGVFNRTTIHFSHIPAVPDGYRITAITGTTLANINSDITTLYIDKSDWVNLKSINDLVSTSRTIYADLDGSIITNINSLLNTENSKLYLKADLSQLIGVYILSNKGLYTLDMVFAANDYYKDLNIPITDNNTNYIQLSSASYGYLGAAPILQWEGEGPFKLEYWFNIIDYVNIYALGTIQVYSLSKQYYFKNINYNSAGSASFHLTCRRTDMEDTEITIDCTNGVSDVILDYDLTWRSDKQVTWQVSGINMTLKPIVYLGNVTSIGTYNPYLKIENDEWPEFNQSLVNKLNPTLGQQIFKNARLVNITKKCPYTVDARNLDYIDMFHYANVTMPTSFENIKYNNYYDFLPTIIVDTSKVYERVRFESSANKYIVFPLSNVKTKRLNITNVPLFDNSTNINITATEVIAGDALRVYDVTKPVITLKKLSDDVTISSNAELNAFVVGGDINIIDIDATDEELLEGGYIATMVNIINTSTVVHPLVLSKCGNINTSGNYRGQAHYTNFRLIYRSGMDVGYTGYTATELINFVKSLVRTDNEVEYKWLFDDNTYQKLQDNYYQGLTLEQYMISMGYTPGRKL